MLDLDCRTVTVAPIASQSQIIAEGNVQITRIDENYYINIGLTVTDYKQTLKAKKILTDLAAGKTVEEKASKYGAKAQLISDVGLSYSSNTLKGAGSAPLAIGKAFSMKEGETSSPFAGVNGVFVLQLIKINKAADVADYEQYKNEILRARTVDMDRQIVNSLKELTNTSENISTFY